MLVGRTLAGPGRPLTTLLGSRRCPLVGLLRRVGLWVRALSGQRPRQLEGHRLALGVELAHLDREPLA
jgi:hypothetical protein